MLNVAKGVYNISRLPVVMVKSVSLLPQQMEENEEKTLEIEVTALLQCPASRLYNKPFNLSVTAVTDMMKIREYQSASGKARLRKLATQKSSHTVNTVVEQFSKKDKKLYYNQKESSSIAYKKITVPIILKNPKSITDITLVMFVNEVPEQSISKSPIDLTTASEPLRMSSAIFEDVMRSSKPLVMTRVYKLKESVQSYGVEGEIWSGPIHIHQGTPMAGAKHTQKPQPTLEFSQTMNQKLKDYRSLDPNNFLNRINRYTDKEEYISEVLYSRSKEGQLNLYFTFDLLGYAQRKSAYSHIIKNDASLLSSMELSEVKIYRTRVGGNNLGNRLTPSLKGSAESCQSAGPEKILVARLSNNTVQVVNSTRDTQPRSIEMIAIDNQIPDELQSYYSYEIVIEFLDRTSDLIKRIRSNLEEDLSAFKEYLDIFTNRVSKGYDIDAYALSAQKKLEGNLAWKTLIKTYVGSLATLQGPTLSPMPLLHKMITFASPNSADERSLNTFQSIILDFINKLDMALSGPVLGKGSEKPKFGSKISTSNAQRARLKYVSVPRNKYYHEYNNSTGLDYIDSQNPATSQGLSRISFDEYQNRISREVSKYSVQSETSPAVNRYGFVTPSKVKTNTIDIEMSRNVNFEKSYDLLQATTSPNAKSPSNNFIGNPEVPSVSKANVTNMLSINGVLAEELYEGKALLSNVYDAKPPDSSNRDSSGYLSSGSSFVRDDEHLRTAQSGSEEFDYKSFNVVNSRVLKSVAVKNLIQKTADSYRKPSPTNLDNIRGSLAYEELVTSSEEFDFMNPLEQNINYNSVVRVEYLRGFDPNGNPNWKTMDIAEFTRAKQDGFSMLCRLSSASQVLASKNYFDLGKYDSVFIIGPKTLSGRDVRTPLSELEKNINNVGALLTRGVLNYKGAGTPVLTQYLCSPSMTYSNMSPAAAARAREASVAAAAPTFVEAPQMSKPASVSSAVASLDSVASVSATIATTSKISYVESSK